MNFRIIETNSDDIVFVWLSLPQNTAGFFNGVISLKIHNPLC